MNNVTQDLFQVSSSSVPTSSNTSSAISSTPTTLSQANNLIENNFFNPLLQLNLEVLIIFLNRFLLGWTIFYSIYFLLHFWWKRLDRAGELKNERDGVEGIKEAILIWLRYLAFLLIISIFSLSLNTSFEIIFLPLVLLFGIYKIWADISGVLKFSSYFGWAGAITKNLQKIFRG
jgi:hypothetical protein